MRVSKTFNQNSHIPLVLKTLADDLGSTNALGSDILTHLQSARSYLNDTDHPPAEPNQESYRSFALPILDALARICDPDYIEGTDTTTPKSANFDWIISMYASRALTSDPIKSEDLYKIKDEITYFNKARQALDEKNVPSRLSEYKSYDDFTAVIRPMLNHHALKKPKTLSDDIKDQTTILYDGEEGRIVIPHSVRASQYWGNGTNWCISGTNDAHFKFPEYDESSPCLLYIPNRAHIDLTNGDITSGKVAVIENQIYNEYDQMIDELPDYVLTLKNAALKALSTGEAAYLKAFGNTQPANMPHDSSEGTNAYLLALPQWQADLIYSGEQLDDHPELLQDKPFMLAYVSADGFHLRQASDAVRQDPDAVLAAVKQNFDALHYADHTLKNDRDFTLALMSVNGLALRQSYFKDAEMTLAAAQQNAKALNYIDPELLDDEAFLEDFLDLIDESPDETKSELLNYIHRMPAFQHRLTSNTDDLREHLSSVHNIPQRTIEPSAEARL